MAVTVRGVLPLGNLAIIGTMPDGNASAARSFSCAVNNRSMNPIPGWAMRTRDCDVMTKAQFDEAFAMAKSDRDLPPCDGIFLGFGLDDFKPVTVDVEAVAGLLRYQGQYLFGGWDWVNVDEVRRHGKRKFMII